MKSLDCRLLRALREATVHLPADELAAQLGEPPGAVRARLVELRAAGFEIEERPTLGFRLIASPDRLIADDLAARLGDLALVRELVVFEKTGSTNELALQRGRQGAPAGLVIFAERQTAGRGRFGRRWESASHRGLWFSLLLRPELPAAHWPRLTTWAAAAMAAALERVAGRPSGIKWPNDVFFGERKVAGILIESGTDAAGKLFAVVGMGVNVNHETSDFPPEIATRATSVRIVTGRRCDRSELAVEVLTQLDARFNRIGDSFAQLVRETTARSLLLGRWVQLRAGTRSHEGIAESLDENGHLVLRAGDGTASAFMAGEVTVWAATAVPNRIGAFDLSAASGDPPETS